MSDDTLAHTVLVLTDKPEAYAKDMRRFGLKALYAPTVEGLLNHLLDNPTSGFILEVSKVMRTPSVERDRLFRIAGSFPVLRSRRTKATGKVSYLDDPECFLSNTLSFRPRKLRCHSRVPVRLNALLAGEDDHLLAKPIKASLLDISESGAFAYSLEPFEGQHFLLLRILELSDPAPIFANVRWRKKWGEPHSLPGLGLLFVGIKPGQVEELNSRYIDPPKDKTLVDDDDDCDS